MFTADAKRLTSVGARKIMATAIAKAQEAGVAVTVAIVDAGGHVLIAKEDVAITRLMQVIGLRK